MNFRQSETQQPIVGWLHILLSILLIAGGLMGGLVLHGVGQALGVAMVSDVLNMVGAAGAGFFILLAVPSMLSGYALLTGRRWARSLALGVAILNLVNFPVGTAVGIFTLWVLLPGGFNREPGNKQMLPSQ